MAKRFQKRNVMKQLQAILDETDNPAIIQDVVDTEIGVISGEIEDFEKNVNTSTFQKSIVRNSVDGKTWNQVDDR